MSLLGEGGARCRGHLGVPHCGYSSSFHSTLPMYPSISSFPSCPVPAAHPLLRTDCEPTSALMGGEFQTQARAVSGTYFLAVLLSRHPGSLPSQCLPLQSGSRSRWPRHPGTLEGHRDTIQACLSCQHILPQPCPGERWEQGARAHPVPWQRPQGIAAGCTGWGSTKHRNLGPVLAWR